MSATDDIRRGAARIEHALDEAFSRYAGVSEAERIEAITAALREALAAEPESLQRALLDALAERYPPIEAVTADPAAAEELRAMQAQVAQLKLDRERQPHAPASAPVIAFIEALLGPEAERVTGEAEVDAARAVGAVRLLTDFAVDLARAFLAAAARGGDTARQVDRFRATLRGELAGSVPAGSLEALLGEIKRQVGGQIEVFPVACRDGAQQMLREIDPLAIEDQASEAGVRYVGGIRPFRYREAWEMFQKRHAELMASEDLFQTYFDGPLRRALYRLREST